MEPVLNFVQDYRVPISTAALGVGLWLLRRYLIGSHYKSSVRIDGKVVLITGANTGIGYETALDLARRGADIILACRNLSKANKAAEQIRGETGNPKGTIMKLDLASLHSVRDFCDNFKESYSKLDVLINNAGLYGGLPTDKTEDGFEMQMGVNHLGHFLLTLLLLDVLKETPNSRVVNVSSILHANAKIDFNDLFMKKKYSASRGYANSKLANIFFTKELTRRLSGTTVHTYVLHPGAVKTEIARNVDWLNSIILFLVAPFMKTASQGALTSIYCAVDEKAGRETGLYYSDCTAVRPFRSAEDKEASRKLWILSEKLVQYSLPT